MRRRNRAARRKRLSKYLKRAAIGLGVAAGGYGIYKAGSKINRQKTLNVIGGLINKKG